MFKEFRAFVMRGNVLDLAVGVIIGAAFGKIVTSLVNDILMPPIGFLLGGIDFSNFFISMNGQAFGSLADAQAAGAPTLNYGLFINNILDFLIVALAIFLLIRQVNRFQAKAPVAPTAAVVTQDCPYCQSVISIKAVRCPYCTSHIEPASQVALSPAD
jgi:large conductance mechanosensitive channel